MISASQLYTATASLISKAVGAVDGSNSNVTGRWKEFAEAAELIAGASTTTSDTVAGYMKRAAVALETLSGTSGAEETEGRAGLLKRVVDALEAKGVVGTGSYGDRLVAGAAGAVFSPFLAIVNRVNMTVTDLGNGAYRLEKTGGSPATYDASAVSSKAAPGDCALKCAFTYTDNQTGFVGLNDDPLASDTWQDINYGLIWSGGSWYVYESSANPFSWVSGVETTVWIRRVGSTITFLEGPVLGSATLRYTSLIPSSAPLYFDSSIQDTVVDITASLEKL